MRHLAPWALAGLFTGISLLAVGCRTNAEAAQHTDDGVSAIQFKDIAIPDGMVLRERNHQSDSLELGEYRYANMVYAGAVPIPEVSSYLRERLAQHSWNLTSESAEGGAEKLTFERGKYVLDCALRRPENDARTELSITVRTTAHRAQ